MSGREWWKHATIYHIYPSSFLDANGDGIGDLKGITSKVDYLYDLGVNVAYLSPVYPSPNIDQGYDISNYCDISSDYGTMKDWEALLSLLHSKGMKLIMDLVVNHSSDQHPWFQSSRSSKTDPKRDFYIWRPGTFGAEGEILPPNNWTTMQGVSCWEYDELTEEYYLHLYTPQQPDLNWDNPRLREAVYDIMRFWLDKGVDGFRMDAINLISKTEGLPNAPITNPDTFLQPARDLYTNGPRVHEYIKEMNTRVLSAYPHAVSLGQLSNTLNVQTVLSYVHPSCREFNLCYYFPLNRLDDAPGTGPFSWRQWRVQGMADILEKWNEITTAGGWEINYLETHDGPRAVSRYTDDDIEDREVGAKLLAMLQISRPGTLVIYQGMELGMRNIPKTWDIKEYRDWRAVNYFHKVKLERQAAGEQFDMSDVLNLLQKKSRDNARTPMQWSGADNAGFTTGEPWMRVNDDYQTCNAEIQEKDEKSVLSFWKRMLRFRQLEKDVFVYGSYQGLQKENKHILSFVRTSSRGKSALVVLNFSAGSCEYILPQEWKNARMVVSNVRDTEEFDGGVDMKSLEKWEGRIYWMDSNL
ncbi:glycoside hydrolase family 13 protein [Atractiella rhizophila]|nr:glycoside hydrolase family 13 protein [Atractiella rhizophila]